MWQIQVSGPWAGSIGGWRPAVDGTYNQTGLSCEEASTFQTEEEADEVLTAMWVDCPGAQTAFRIVEKSHA